jgi:outer membrane receptor protein involved in Fe transport
VQWGGLATAGIETENHNVNIAYLYTRVAEDTATLAEDIRGKEFFFPGYDPTDPDDPGNQSGARNSAPYLRTETLEYTERVTETFILNGKHTLPFSDFGIDDFITFNAPVLDWTYAQSSASLDQPDKRQFGTRWQPQFINPGFPPIIPPTVVPAAHRPLLPADSAQLGFLQRVFKEINEKSDQAFVNLKLPFEQWTEDEGYLKFGVYSDEVIRNFRQQTYSNFGDSSSYQAAYDDLWSAAFPDEDYHQIDESLVDVNYRGTQDVFAYYAMADLPLNSWINIIGGVRFESTSISTENFPEPDASWFPPGALTSAPLLGDEADAFIEQDDWLPAISLVFQPIEEITIRASYSETIARMTFKELTPVRQQEFLGGPIFIGNPELQLSALKNYDLRFDYTPYQGGLVSVSWFYKDIKDPIEFVQRVVGFSFTTPVNYPSGEISGFEFEVRQDLGQLWDELSGLSIGGNATIIESEVQLPQDEIDLFAAPNINVDLTSRDATNAPAFLYNIYLTYDVPDIGTQVSLFYTVKGDTLVAGAGRSENNFIPNIYATEYGTLNLSVSQKLGENFKLTFKAKNLTDPEIQEVYRSDVTGPDLLRSSFTKGIDFSIGLSASFTF